MQVADAFRSYAKRSKGCKVVALCGGNDMRQQLKQLEKASTSLLQRLAVCSTTSTESR